LVEQDDLGQAAVNRTSPFFELARSCLLVQQLKSKDDGLIIFVFLLKPVFRGKLNEPEIQDFVGRSLGGCLSDH
jgi:hypothetical protein